MKPEHGLFSIFLAVSLTPLTAVAGPVQAVVENVPDAVGTIKVAVCTEDEFLKPSCKFHGEIKSVASTVTVKFADIPAGIYAVQAYQDRNDNARLDRSFIGIPQEPIGFSRNPAVRFGPPSFDDCAVSLTPGGGEIKVRLITH